MFFVFILLNYNPIGLIIFFGGLSGLFLLQFLRRIMAKGEIQEAYFSGENQNYLYLLTDHNTTLMGGRGITINHYFHLKKINIDTLKVEYYVKVARFIAPMLSGYMNLIGHNEHFIYLRLTGKKLVIVNNKTGEIAGTAKDIKKLNPEIKKFDVDQCAYSVEKQRLKIFDDKGYGYFLDPETLIVEITDFNFNPEDQKLELQDISNFPKIEMNDNEVFNSKPNSYGFYFYGRNLRYESDKGSKRYYLLLDTDENKAEMKGLSKSFLCPNVFSGGSFNDPVVTDYNNMFVLHAETSPSKADKLYLSLIDSCSREIWQLRLDQIIEKPKFFKNNILLYKIINGTMWFFSYIERTGVHISVSKLNLENGDIIAGPELFVNSSKLTRILRKE